MDKRVPVTEETHDRLKLFRDGAGFKSFDEAVNLLLDIISGDDEYNAGIALGSAKRSRRKISKPVVTDEVDDSQQ